MSLFLLIQNEFIQTTLKLFGIKIFFLSSAYFLKIHKKALFDINLGGGFYPLVVSLENVSWWVDKFSLKLN